MVLLGKKTDSPRTTNECRDIIISNMAIQDTDKLFSKLEKMGEETVRLRLAQGAFAPQRKIKLVKFWLSENAAGRKQPDKVITKSNAIDMKPTSKEVWDEISKDYEVTKMSFAKKINFVSDKFKKSAIFRDIEQSYSLANLGYSKPAVILAGSVIEELLRIYLNHKQIIPARNNFDSYIKACEDNGLIKSAIHRLTDSVRHFRNFVHLEKEESKRTTISKATAKGAVSSIFTIVNDL